MTLDEIIKDLFEQKVPNAVFGDDRTSTMKDLVRQACLDYAKSIIPEKQSSGWHTLESNCDCSKKAADFNTCRTLMLSRIEEDSK